MEKDWKFILKFFQQFLFILRIKSNLLLKDLCLHIIHHLKPLFSLLLPGEATTHFSILAWRIPWTEEPDKLQSMGLERAGHDLSNWAHMYTQQTFQILEHIPPYFQRIFQSALFPKIFCLGYLHGWPLLTLRS